MAGRTFIISGVSGSGKSTLSDRLVDRHEKLVRSITVTTRPPRTGELFGSHYFFASSQIFDWLLKTDQLLEYTQVYGDTFYGTLKISVNHLLAEGNDVLFVVDNRGVVQITEHFPNSKSIFLRAPSEEVQRQRLEERGTRGDDLEIRVKRAQDELKWAEGHGIHIVTNDMLEDALQEVEGIFFQAK